MTYEGRRRDGGSKEDGKIFELTHVVIPVFLSGRCFIKGAKKIRAGCL